MTYEIYDRYAHLNNTDAGVAALEAYEEALAAGKSANEAEVIASNVLQRAGYNVNRTGGVSIRETDFQAYDIIVSSDTDDGEQFVSWLDAKGHTAKVGNDTGNYINGTRTSTDEDANEIMRSLWDAYCNQR